MSSASFSYCFLRVSIGCVIKCIMGIVNSKDKCEISCFNAESLIIFQYSIIFKGDLSFFFAVHQPSKFHYFDILLA